MNERRSQGRIALVIVAPAEQRHETLLELARHGPGHAGASVELAHGAQADERAGEEELTRAREVFAPERRLLGRDAGASGLPHHHRPHDAGYAAAIEKRGAELAPVH